MIGSPLGVALMRRFESASSVGVAETFLAMGVIYGAFMLAGAFAIRIPPPDWRPSGFTPPVGKAQGVAGPDVHADRAIRTPQFYLLWVMLCFNVTAGIAILGKASDMLQEIFGATKESAAGFVGLLSIASMVGRIGWSSASDYLGRKATYAAYFGLGAVLYGMLPTLGANGLQGGFVFVCVAIMTMYGGGFATIPAYLRDAFGTMHVGAIHGRLLTAWSTAGVLGPMLVTRWAEAQKAAATPPSEAYGPVLYFMVALLAIGFVCNWRMSPVDSRHHHRAAAAREVVEMPNPTVAHGAGPRTSAFTIAAAWLFVGGPLAWGLYHTLMQAGKLIR